MSLCLLVCYINFLILLLDPQYDDYKLLKLTLSIWRGHRDSVFSLESFTFWSKQTKVTIWHQIFFADPRLFLLLPLVVEKHRKESIFDLLWSCWQVDKFKKSINWSYCVKKKKSSWMACIVSPCGIPLQVVSLIFYSLMMYYFTHLHPICSWSE